MAVPWVVFGSLHLFMAAPWVGCYGVYGGNPMKTVILADGMGTRFADETDNRPKPMVEISGKPILWHIMKYCKGDSYHGK